MTPAEHSEATKVAAEQALAALRGLDHDIVLGALLTAYRDTALRNACCTAEAAVNCMRLGTSLALREISHRPPGGTTTH